MTKLPLGLLPRVLDREQAAEYCGCKTVGAFDEWVRHKIVPGPIKGTKRWDCKAIDRALDRVSGFVSKEPSLEEWLAEHDD